MGRKKDKKSKHSHDTSTEITSTPEMEQGDAVERAAGDDTSHDEISADENEDLVSFVPGSSVIDIGELRRAQANRYDDSIEEETLEAGEDNGLSLDEEADLIRAELDSDPELRKDVLRGYNADESNENLDRIKESVHDQELQHLHAMEKLAERTSGELHALNELFIAEDKLLEGKMAQETMAEAMALAETRDSSKKKGQKGKKKAATEATPDTAAEYATDGEQPLAMGFAESLEASAEAKPETEFTTGFTTDLGSESILDSDIFADDDEEGVADEDMSEEDQALRNALPHADEDGEYNLEDLQSCIEALLFYSDRSVSFKRLKEMLEMTEADDAPILAAIEQLKASYQTHAHGFEIAEIAGGYQLRTKPSRAPLLRKLAKVQVQRLSRGAMEALTICAYKQPCTKDDIDQVRGVDSSHFIRTLLDRKLIEVTGRSEAAGRPMIYSTTDTFLEMFGLMDLKGMPPLHEIEAMVPQLANLAEGEEDPRVIQMRKMVNQMKVEANHLDYNAKEDEVILQEIRDRVKSIDISTPYLERQKALAAEGIVGDEADQILAVEFGFARTTAGGEEVAPVEVQTEANFEAAPAPDSEAFDLATHDFGNPADAATVDLDGTGLRLNEAGEIIRDNIIHDGSSERPAHDFSDEDLQ